MRVAILAAVAFLAAATAASAQAPLLHYSFDGDPAGQCLDLSGSELHATAGGSAVDSPLGQAMFFDGTADTVVRVELPPQARFGAGSWSFLAWLRPERLAIDDTQNQRRVFSYGAFPEANLVIDVMASGQVTSYFCYRGEDGEVVSMGASSALSVAEGEWAHIGLTCDREAREVSIYVNGYSVGAAAMPEEFDGDFSAYGELTLGSGWHNYWGLMDEAFVYRRALSPQEVREAFRMHADEFGVSESPLTLAAERRERLEAAMTAAMEAWAEGDFPRVREECARITEDEGLEPQLRSYAHLIAAQSYSVEGDEAAARAEYARIAGRAEYPFVHRMEAEDLSGEPRSTRTEPPQVQGYAAEVFVARDGNDAGVGAREFPLASLSAARDRVRALRAEGVTGAIAVQIAPGEYRVTETLELGPEDSGTEEGPVVYRADGGPVVLYGGVRLDGFEEVSDPAVLLRLPEEGRAHVVQCDLNALGINDYGELRVRGCGQPPAPPTLELYVDGQPMTIARWPNEGFVRIAELVEPGSRDQGVPSAFRYLDDRHERWLDEEDGWLFGYFRWLWADGTAKIGGIDPETDVLTTAEAYQYGGGGMSNDQGIMYYAFNLLEELDAPGEWYLNRDTGMLYLYPPTDFAEAVAEIGLFSEPMILAEDVSHVRFEGLTLDLGRYRGMALWDCSDCAIVGCTVSRMADNGIMVHRGQRCTIHSCDVHTIGRRALEVTGGDRETLEPGGNLVENCRIHSCGRIDRTYTPAIQLEGVGNRVVHNLMYDVPSSAMRIEGNDHLVANNEFHSVVLESDDQGAIDIYGNPTYRGMVFRHNYFHDLGNLDPTSGVHGQAGIRFDDAISGMVVYGNLFERSANGNFGGVQMNSGRDNIMDGNAFLDCSIGISGGYYAGNSVWQTLRSGQAPDGFYLTDLYLERYPEMARMLEEPALSFAWRNVFWRCGRVASNPGGLEMIGNQVLDQDAPMPDVTQPLPGFRPIPLDDIGLYNGRYRSDAK